MGSRERVAAALAQREPGRVPAFELNIDAPMATEILGCFALVGWNRCVRGKLLNQMLMAGRGEEFDVAELFQVEELGRRLIPAQERERGFRHLAWRDLSERLGGSVWAALAVITVLLGAGAISAVRGLDPS